MIEIIAINITNLTDARYFAARGAKWIFYTVKDIEDIPKIKAIQEWVDGPYLGISLIQESSLEHKDLILKELDPIGIMSNDPICWKKAKNFILTSNPDNQINEDAAIVLITEKLNTIKPESYLYKKSWTDQEIKSMNQLKLAGIVISGSEENKPGLKNYDLHDKLLDEIEKVNYV